MQKNMIDGSRVGREVKGCASILLCQKAVTKSEAGVPIEYSGHWIDSCDCNSLFAMLLTCLAETTTTLSR